ncbi:pentatricopeptide repeat-containing protein At5g04780 [Phalaenopsis equestris]|uniref:pentatricopeptide repeat-containing protein At5g04780 n=1 Tax=Phalaenopsis equestris TaxID=78828 RepID=UPI0009E40C1D|nr:pentatricopeptide repeat-containing protein At5g04780 [Phalaenopsis equestris]
MPTRSIVSWNTMIAGHNNHGEYVESLTLFQQICRQGLVLSEFTLSSILCACAEKIAVFECRQLHGLALKIARDSNVFVGTALLDVYAKSNMINDSVQVFDNLTEKSSVTWSSMVSAYVHNDLHEEALVLISKSQKMDLEWTKFTLSAALSACTALAATIGGTQLHSVIVRTGFDSDIFVSTALTDLYAKSGCIKEAWNVFSIAEEKSIVLWNAMIAGFSRHARCLETIMLFEKLRSTGICPNEVTFVSVLSSCSHAGSVESGRFYFDLMRKDGELEPNVLHYSCMVDVLGRSGFIEEAWELIQNMPFAPTGSIWGSLLSSCRIHGNLQLAKVAAEHLFEIEPENAGNRVLLSNLYAASKNWEKVAVLRKNLKDNGVKREKGRSWIEVRDKVHVFVVGEYNHPRISEIYIKLEDLRNEMKKLAYKTQNECDFHDVDEEQKEELLGQHSERLAFAFGLISLPPDATIRINKNLRVCGDCHSFLKLGSKISGREIIVRDIKRFHHFCSGLCSCRDFW